MSSPITEEMLVMCNKGDKLVGGGFTLEGLANSNAVETFSDSNNQKGGSAFVSGLKGLAVPAGLLYLQKSMQEKYYEFEDKDTVIDDSLFDKLYSMATDSEDSKKKKKKNKKQRKTKKKSNKTAKRGTRRTKK